jgi:integrase
VFTDPTSAKVKYASAHDLRRSFGDRWKTRVMPHTLKELMRHKNIETTNRFYISENAASTAQLLWAKSDLVDTLVDISQKPPELTKEGLPQPQL